MIKLFIWLFALIVLCLCLAGLAFAILSNRGTRSPVILPSESQVPVSTSTQQVSPTSSPIATSSATSLAPTSNPNPSPTASPVAAPETVTVSESGAGGETFFPYQSSTVIEMADCLPYNAEIISATVVQVIDGDTIDVLLNGEEQRVRYIGIDSPEMDYPLGAEARAENAKLVDGQVVWMVKDESETDPYQRLLRYVFVGDVFVNEQLVRSGYAMAKAYEPDTSCEELFDQAETEAKSAGLGLWVPTATPMPASVSAGFSGPSIVIQNIFFDGLVKRVESDEYVEIANSGSLAVDLDGWRLNAGNPGQDYLFPSYSLEPGASLRVYTNQTHAETGGFSFTSQDPLWNNKGDCGYLYDAQGTLVDDYCY